MNIERHGTITLSFVWYGCETWSVTLRQEHMLTVFENGLLTGIFGPKGREAIVDWRRLHNEELYDLYCSTGFVVLIK